MHSILWTHFFPVCDDPEILPGRLSPMNAPHAVALFYRCELA